MNTQYIIQPGDSILVCGSEAFAALNHSTHHLDWSHFEWWYPIMWALILLVVIGLLLSIFSYVKPLLNKKLSWLALGVWLSGFGLYCIGFNHEGSDNFLILALRASLSSVEMFASHSDLLEVQHSCHASKGYMLAFAITHFMAVVVSAAFIVSLMGLRFVSRFQIYKKHLKLRIHQMALGCIRRFGWSNREEKSLFREDWYIFWGVNPNSILVAKSIEPRQGRKCYKLFVNLPGESKTHAHTHSSHFSLSQLFHSSDGEIKKYVEAIKDMGAMLVDAHHPFVKDSFKHQGKGGEVVIFKHLGISFCDELIENILLDKGNKVEYFFLSEDNDANIAAIVALKAVYAKAETNSQKKREKRSHIKCYCHARRNSVNTELLQCPGLNDQIYLVDSSSLAVMNIRSKPDSDPVNFVEVDSRQCTAHSPFTAMVIGFGETGRDAFRYLYEFASLPCNELGEENPKTIYVVDEKLKALKADFLKSAPALNNSAMDDWWIEGSTHSVDFWQVVKSNINSLNYIVITVGSDEEAMNLAVDMYEYAYRYRADMLNFRIYVRLRSNEKNDDIKQLYNNYIVPFGDDSSIFTYSYISMNEVEQGAERFYYAYEKTFELEEAKKKNVSCQSDINLEFEDKNVENEVKNLWTERRATLNAASEDVIKNRTQQITLHYKEAQDISNYRHIATKRYLAGGNITSYQGLTETQKKSLANCEHLRWNAKMELLGFVYGDPGNVSNKDIRRRIHRCITSCQVLRHGKDADTVKYDNIVIKVTFRPEFKPKGRC